MLQQQPGTLQIKVYSIHRNTGISVKSRLSLVDVKLIHPSQLTAGSPKKSPN